MNSDTQQSEEAGVPTPPPGPYPLVTSDELARYADLIYHRTGIRVANRKKVLLSNRLRRRLRETRIRTFAAYYEHLKGRPANHPEWDAFLQEITTHETFLFRDMNQWEWFSKSFLPQLSNKAREGHHRRRLRIWSAACSNGDEAFTIACCVAACLPHVVGWNIQIVGTDIGVGAIQQAATGVFGERSMRLVPESLKKRFFRKARHTNEWQASPILGQMVTFRPHNLLDPLADDPFDLVFLKNVLIYFDRQSKRRVMGNIRKAIRPGGFFVAGPTDGVGEFVHDYVRHHAWLFQRPK